jgi:predicted TIM-barrel fold metal-dependent hydrolase
MRNSQRIFDLRNRPPLAPYAQLFEIKRDLLGPPLKRFGVEIWFRWLTGTVSLYRNRGAATTTPSMRMVGQPGAIEQWWREIDAAGIDCVCSPGRITEDRGKIDAATLAQLQKKYPNRFYGLAPANLEQDAATTVAECEKAVRELGLRGINIEPGIRKRGGPAHVDNPNLFPIYEAMIALDVPVMVYTSAFAGPNPYFANDMAPYERVLSKFPKLKIILGHGGYPRVKQVVETAPRHPNLFICQDVYTFWPAGHLYRAQIGKLQDQYIFGTAYPFSSMAEPLEASLKLPLSASAREKYFWGNAARLHKINAASR